MTGIAVLVVIALAVAGFAGSRIASHLSHQNTSDSAAAQHQALRQGNQGTRAKTGHGTGSTANPAQSSKSSKTPKKPAPIKAPQAAAVSWLPVEFAEAFGPDGTADGDNPQGAQFAITASSLPWRTDWYTTASFGMLKSGTGLLLDMGKTDTITSVRIDLSSYQGADLQLRLGSSPTLTGLRTAASAADVGGTVRLTLHSPVLARYVLIWFTQLPPNGAGRYQESVYRIVVNGRP